MSSYSIRQVIAAVDPAAGGEAPRAGAQGPPSGPLGEAIQNTKPTQHRHTDLA